LFVGWAPQGPVDHALHLTGFSDYERNYGGFDEGSLLGYAVRQFYDNGGVDVCSPYPKHHGPSDFT
jgi:hypothetical protein